MSCSKFCNISIIQIQEKKMVSNFNKPLGTKFNFVKSMFCSKFCNIRHRTDKSKLDICHLFGKEVQRFSDSHPKCATLSNLIFASTF